MGFLQQSILLLWHKTVMGLDWSGDSRKAFFIMLHVMVELSTRGAQRASHHCVILMVPFRVSVGLCHREKLESQVNGLTCHVMEAVWGRNGRENP